MINTSIIIPVYNCERYIGQAVTSALRQYASECPYEIIVVNDGSTDGTRGILFDMQRNLPTGAIRIVDQDNGGQAAAENTGICAFREKNVLLLDADDLLAPEAIEILATGLKTHSWATGEYSAFSDTTGKHLYTTDKSRFSHIGTREETHPLLYANISGHPKAFTRREAEIVGGLDASLRVANDYDLALKILYPGIDRPFHYTGCVLY